MQGQGLLVVIDALGVELDALRRASADAQEELAALRAQNQQQADEIAKLKAELETMAPA